MSLTPEQRTQVARLLGTGWEVGNKAVTLRALALALAEHGLTVRQFVELMDGRKLTVRRETQAVEQRAAEEERRSALRILRAVGIAEPVGNDWLTGPRAPRSGSGAAVEPAQRIALVWPRLPWDGTGLRLAQLAAETTGDAHGLDYTTDLGRTVARLIHTEREFAHEEHRVPKHCPLMLRATDRRESVGVLLLRWTRSSRVDTSTRVVEPSAASGASASYHAHSAQQTHSCCAMKGCCRGDQYRGGSGAVG
ncbi:TIGR02679 domain-containing protein [Nocardia takedensis]|uniref:TIGR02679 domain-containing protein n=1 Tax=Nocardia takedensis TaxID=259390 RepID=UPI0012F6478A